VGAGLPAMRETRSLSKTEAMLSQASQLPHWIVVILGVYQPNDFYRTKQQVKS